MGQGQSDRDRTIGTDGQGQGQSDKDRWTGTER